MRPLKLLMELYTMSKGSRLAGMILETCAAAQEHGTATARIGANRDGSVTVYATDERVAQGIAGILRKAGAVCKSVRIPPVGFQQFHRLITDSPVAQVLVDGFEGEAPITIRTGEWPELCARAALRDLVDQCRNGTDAEQQGGKTIELALMADSQCCASEGRFRTTLNEALGWTADKLNEAVVDVMRRASGDAKLQGK